MCVSVSVWNCLRSERIYIQYLHFPPLFCSFLILLFLPSLHTVLFNPSASPALSLVSSILLRPRPTPPAVCVWAGGRDKNVGQENHAVFDIAVSSSLCLFPRVTFESVLCPIMFPPCHTFSLPQPGRLCLHLHPFGVFVERIIQRVSDKCWQKFCGSLGHGPGESPEHYGYIIKMISYYCKMGCFQYISVNLFKK